MKEIANLIKEGRVTLLSGQMGIGVEIFYQNLLINQFIDKKVLILTNSMKKDTLIRSLNRILYADKERHNKFNNFIVEDYVLDIDDAINIIRKKKDEVQLIIIDKIDNFNVDMKEVLEKLYQISKEIKLPFLLCNDLYMYNLKYRELKIDDLEMTKDDLAYFSGFILINRESYYVKNAKNEMDVSIIYSHDLNLIKRFKYKHNRDYDSLYSLGEEDCISMDTIMGFDNIAGYDDVKRDLLLIKSWLDNKTEIRKKGIDIPKGVLFYGPVGTGKSMFAREFTNLFPNATVLKIKFDNDFGRDVVTETFEYARSLKRFVIIQIDEFDLIARREERELLTELDGLGGDNSEIFVIGTCNGYDNINPALTRRGRLDYIIGIGNPTEKDRISLLKFYFDKYGIKGEFDYEYLALITSGENAVNIKAIANETRLRYGENPTLGNIEAMIDKIDKRNREYYGDSEKHDRFLEAVHEVGHAVVAWQHQDFFKFYKAMLEDNSLAGGICKMFPTSLMPGSTERSIADIEISMGGYLACLMLYNYKDKGAVLDLERARHQSAALVNSYGYNGFESLLNHNIRGFQPSPDKKRNNEKKSEKILSKCEKNVRRIIRDNKENIIKLANMLVEIKVLTSDDLKIVLG